MNKLFITLLFILVGVSYAQPPEPIPYEPTQQTIVAINESAHFTDGRVVPCPTEPWNGMFSLCVDASNTHWTQDQLADWADYGFGSWVVYKAWTIEDGFINTTRVNPDTSEVILISVHPGQYIVYIVTAN